MKTTITYLDFNATTPVDNRVIEVINSHFTTLYGNASSQYSFGDISKKTIESARLNISNLIDSEPENIYFTSGATESINLALKGLALNPNNKNKHIITCSTEHKAVLETCTYLESIGYEVDYLPVNKEGVLDLELLNTSIKNNTLLICLMWVNNETGVIHNIKEIGEIAKKAGIYFVCDGTQGVGKLVISLTQTNIDVFCFSGHKIYGPKGVGGIFINKDIIKKNKVLPLIHGGGQENNLRSGTYNVPLIAGFGKAYEIALEEMAENRFHIESLQKYLESELLQIEGVLLNGNSSSRIYNTTNVCIPGLETGIFINMNKDIAVSNGSACNSALIQPSHVLLSMGLSNEAAMNSLRISIGKHSTKEDIQLLVQRIKDFINNF